MAYSIVEVENGNFVVVGRTSSFGAGGFDFWVLKLQADGSTIWQKTYGGQVSEEPFVVIETQDLGYAIVGYTQSFGAGSHDGWVLKLDTNGNVTWQKAYGGEGIDILISIDETSAGDFLVSGYSHSFGNGGQDYWIMKLSSTGEIIWQKNYGGNDSDVAKTMTETLDGGMILGGETRSYGAGNFDIWILKVDSNGEIGPCGASFEGLAEANETSATISNTTVTSQNISTPISDPEWVSQDTSATTYWVCPVYSFFLPIIH